ncbi:MAG: glycosyltransferase [Candidatus Hydrogenedentota bacterium]
MLRDGEAPMNILMVTNTYLPHVGGVAQSVARFSEAYRAAGHEVLVVAPEFAGRPAHEENVVRVPALQNFNGSDFSVSLPVPGALGRTLAGFGPAIVHTHHPFLLGDTALRIAAQYQRPLVFTHHTMYEQYTHYVPVQAPKLAEYVKALTTHYANSCDHVLAPSAHVKRILEQRGVQTPMTVAPTGIDVNKFRTGDGAAFRREHGIPADALLAGHVGRLAPEKNLTLLAQAIARFLRDDTQRRFLVVGAGPSEASMREILKGAGVAGRAHFAGRQEGRALAGAYQAMDVFVFASKSETQGMVLVEALSTGVPVVALDVPPVDEIITDTRNGRLVADETPEAFAQVLCEWAELPPEARENLSAQARADAAAFDINRCAEQALAVYAAVLQAHTGCPDYNENAWSRLWRLISEEWTLWSSRVSAAAEVWGGDQSTGGGPSGETQ